MSEKVEYIRYSEFCDNEGERWHRFIPYKTNDEINNNALKSLFIAIEALEKEFENEYFGSPYKFAKTEDGELKIYSQDKVDLMLEENEHSDCGYMDEYGVSNVNKLNIDVPEGSNEFEHFDSQVYKMKWEI